VPKHVQIRRTVPAITSLTFLVCNIGARCHCSLVNDRKLFMHDLLALLQLRSALQAHPHPSTSMISDMHCLTRAGFSNGITRHISVNFLFSFSASRTVSSRRTSSVPPLPTTAYTRLTNLPNQTYFLSLSSGTHCMGYEEDWLFLWLRRYPFRGTTCITKASLRRSLERRGVRRRYPTGKRRNRIDGKGLPRSGTFLALDCMIWNDNRRIPSDGRTETQYLISNLKAISYLNI
jgi:hypothetical protein